MVHSPRTLIIAFLLIANAYSSDLFIQDWPQPSAAGINAGVSVNTSFYLVGQDGTLLFSSNGNLWSLCSSPTKGDIVNAAVWNEKIHIWSQTLNTSHIASIDTDICSSSWLPQNMNTNPAPLPPIISEDDIYVSLVAEKLYYATNTGDQPDWQTIDSILRPAAVSCNGREWIVKNIDEIDNVTFYNSTNGSQWSDGDESSLRSFSQDHSLSYCQIVQKWIANFAEGTAVSSNGLQWTIVSTTLQNVIIERMTCYQDRCIAVNKDSVYELAGCGESVQEVYLPGLQEIPSSFPVLSADGTFVVAGANGVIYSSSSTLQWESTGSPIKESSSFEGCDQMITNRLTGFFLSCSNSTLGVSYNITEWDFISYEGMGPSQLSFIGYERTQMWGIDEENSLFHSDANPLYFYWEFEIDLSWNSTSNLEIEFFDTISSSFIILGTGQLNGFSDAPLLISSFSSRNWKLYALNYRIYDMVEVYGGWYGAGDGGIFFSPSGSTWNLVQPVNGECWSISSNWNTTLLVQCDNKNEGSNERIVFLSVDQLTWTPPFYSECETLQAAYGYTDRCNPATFVAGWQGFVISSPHPLGIAVYFNATDVATTLLEWYPLPLDLSSSIYEIDENVNRIAMLTETGILGSQTNSSRPFVMEDSDRKPFISYTSTLDGYEPPSFPSGYVLNIPYPGDIGNDASSDSNKWEETIFIFFSVVLLFIALIIFCILLCVVGSVCGCGAIAKDRKTPITEEEKLPILDESQGL